MKSVTNSLLTTSVLLLMWSCEAPTKTEESAQEKRTSIEMITSKGTIVFELYNETPLHRDNFVKLVNDQAYDSLLFHRVIQNFMIQAGDPDSRGAEAGARFGGLSYKVDAEFIPSLFHKKGVLGAARDGNLERASSSMQFYIVQGAVQDDSLLTVAESRINGWLAEHYFKKDTANQEIVSELQKAQDAEDWDSYRLIADSVTNLAKAYENFDEYTIPDAHRDVYKSLGGTPHLDQNYTVFGEVTAGLAVVDSIAATQTGEYARPVNDVHIVSTRILK